MILSQRKVSYVDGIVNERNYQTEVMTDNINDETID